MWVNTRVPSMELNLSRGKLDIVQRYHNRFQVSLEYT